MPLLLTSCTNMCKQNVKLHIIFQAFDVFQVVFMKHNLIIFTDSSACITCLFFFRVFYKFRYLFTLCNLKCNSFSFSSYKLTPNEKAKTCLPVTSVSTKNSHLYNNSSIYLVEYIWEHRCINTYVWKDLNHDSTVMENID